MSSETKSELWIVVDTHECPNDIQTPQIQIKKLMSPSRQKYWTIQVPEAGVEISNCPYCGIKLNENGT